MTTPSSRRRFDGVEDDAMIQHESAVKFGFPHRFSAVGHGVIDDVEMLGRRQDAHPGSHNGEGDTVHYCLPGPIDYALDEVIRVLRRSFDQAPRFYGV